MKKVKLIHSDGDVLFEDKSRETFPMDHGGAYYQSGGHKYYFNVNDSIPTNRNYPPLRLLGTYSSVDEMMKKTGVSPEVRKRIAELRQRTRMATYLAVLRESAGITQKQMADAMKVSQSYISKLEATMDETITIKDLMGYSRVIGHPINLQVSESGVGVKRFRKVNNP